MKKKTTIGSVVRDIKRKTEKGTMQRKKYGLYWKA